MYRCIYHRAATQPPLAIESRYIRDPSEPLKIPWLIGSDVWISTIYTTCTTYTTYSTYLPTYLPI